MSDASVILADLPEGEELARGFLEGLGHPVVVCHGPAKGTLCPMLATDECPKVDSAHGVIFALDLDRPQHRAILQRYLSVLREDIPVSVVTSQEQAERYRSQLAGVHVWTAAPGVGDLDGFASEVEAADLTR